MQFAPEAFTLQFNPLDAHTGTLLMPSDLPAIPELRNRSSQFEEIDAADFENFTDDLGEAVEFKFHPAPPETIDPPSLDLTVWSRNPAAYFPLDLSELNDSASSSGFSDSGSDTDLLQRALDPEKGMSARAARLGIAVGIGSMLATGIAIGVIFGSSRGKHDSHGSSDPAPPVDEPAGAPARVSESAISNDSTNRAAAPLSDSGPALRHFMPAADAQIHITDIDAIAAAVRAYCADMDRASGLAEAIAEAAMPHDVTIIAVGPAPFAWSFG